jgi:hypothetical protein
MVQEKFLGQGPQDNESAVEQAKDDKYPDQQCMVHAGLTTKHSRSATSFVANTSRRQAAICLSRTSRHHLIVTPIKPKRDRKLHCHDG